MKAIVAVDKKWGIGKKNGLLFDLPADMKFFRETTLGKTVVMGSNTLKSFPNGKPLKNRVNVVLFPGGEKRDDCVVVQDLGELSRELKKYPTDDVFIIGGAMFYKTMLPYCSEVLVTKVAADGGAEVFYENLDELPEWKCVYESEETETNGYRIKFTTYRNGAVKEF
ncbi:MAG: dihydrofolate reductase [Candidatus Borkfalkiaceae bacterium]|nr:dihydrofolate reductase [Christensenellaceae bacterium]